VIIKMLPLQLSRSLSRTVRTVSSHLRLLSNNSTNNPNHPDESDPQISPAPYSSLFVTSKHATKMVSLIRPELNLNRYEDNAYIQRLIYSIELRGLQAEFDVKDIQDKVRQTIRLRKQIEQCKYELRQLKHVKSSDSNLKDGESNDFRSLKDESIKAQAELHELEEQLIPLLMKLPNLLSPEVNESYELMQVRSVSPAKPTFKLLSAKQVSYVNEIRKHSIVGPYTEYWIGEGATLCDALRKFFKVELKSLLQEHEGQVHEIDGLDMIKSAIVEACNDPQSKAYDSDRLRLNRGVSTTAHSQQMHLVGHCSLEAVAAMLSKRPLNMDELPVRFVQDGATYDQRMVQSDGLHLLSVTHDRPHQAEREYQLLLDSVWRLYEKLKLPIMLCNVSARLLPANQQSGHELLIYLPYERQWQKAAELAHYGDYLPARLGLQHLQMIGCNILNNSLMMDAILENGQDQKARYSVPTCVQKYM
jgi:hypothetical protein